MIPASVHQVLSPSNSSSFRFAFRSLASSTEYCFKKSLTSYLRYFHLITGFLSSSDSWQNFGISLFISSVNTLSWESELFSCQ